MLQISGLSKSFDGFTAVRNVSLALDQGERHAIIGPNGAGKTTFFNLITGHLRPDSGTVDFKGKSLTGRAPHQIVKQGLARSFQHINIYPRMSVVQNVQVALIARQGQTFNIFVAAAGLHHQEASELLTLVGLADAEHAVAADLSYGKQKQLELAIALAAAPQLLLLDEPTAGMAPAETMEMLQLIGQIVAARDLTLLFTEHDMDVVFSLAQRISVLHHGEIIATGPPQEIRQDAEVQRVYLGKAADAQA